MSGERERQGRRGAMGRERAMKKVSEKAQGGASFLLVPLACWLHLLLEMETKHWQQ
jgi:hypothetical protein